MIIIDLVDIIGFLVLVVSGVILLVQYIMFKIKGK